MSPEGHVRMPSSSGENTWERSMKARGVERKVLSPGRFWTYCLVQVGAYLAVPDPREFNWAGLIRGVDTN